MTRLQPSLIIGILTFCCVLIGCIEPSFGKLKLIACSYPCSISVFIFSSPSPSTMLKTYKRFQQLSFRLPKITRSANIHSIHSLQPLSPSLIPTISYNNIFNHKHNELIQYTYNDNDNHNYEPEYLPPINQSLFCEIPTAKYNYSRSRFEFEFEFNITSFLSKYNYILISSHNAFISAHDAFISITNHAYKATIFVHQTLKQLYVFTKQIYYLLKDEIYNFKFGIIIKRIYNGISFMRMNIVSYSEKCSQYLPYFAYILPSHLSSIVLKQMCTIIAFGIIILSGLIIIFIAVWFHYKRIIQQYVNQMKHQSF